MAVSFVLRILISLSDRLCEVRTSTIKSSRSLPSEGHLEVIAANVQRSRSACTMKKVPLVYLRVKRVRPERFPLSGCEHIVVHRPFFCIILQSQLPHLTEFSLLDTVFPP